MVYSIIDDRLIKQSLNSAKTVAMIGVSSIKTENPSNIIRRPSIIVMNYLQEFGYKVIPVNPFATGKKINGETVVEKLEDITGPIDIVNVFRPSKEVPIIAKQAVKKALGYFGYNMVFKIRKLKKLLSQKISFTLKISV